MSRSAIAVAATLLLGACNFFVPDTRTPAERANALAPRCRGFEAGAAQASSTTFVESAEPSYARVPGGPNANEFRLRGAKIHLQPMPGATRETLVRALECHEALVVLGQASSAEDDPYVLPGKWLAIDVASAGDGFVVVVESDDHDAAAAVLDRAKRFASRATWTRL